MKIIANLLCIFMATAFMACAVGRGAFRSVEFRSPSLPYAPLRLLLEDAEVIGVLSSTNVEPLRELDIEKVMGRISDEVARALGRMENVRVLTRDEIRWHLKEAGYDSMSVFTVEMRQALRDELEIDVLVHIELKQLQTLLTTAMPTAYTTNTPSSRYQRQPNVNNPGTALNMKVDMELAVSDLRTGSIWRQTGAQSNWQPVELQLFGENQTERQLIAAVSRPLQRFLYYLSPPPQRQVRTFDLSGD